MQQSRALYRRAKQVIPGGVNSPGRSFIGVGGDPIFIKSGSGPYLTDADGRVLLEYVCSMGATVLGSADSDVINKVHDAVNRGLGYWLATELEVQLSEKICELLPSVEMVRLVSSGTEATMSAIRLARAFTKRDKVIKFEGGYHGHNNSMLVDAGSGALDIGVPSSPGVPQSAAQDTLTAEYNNLESVIELFDSNPKKVAAIIVEPVAGNMSCVPPTPGFLQGLRDLCDKNGALLIFDEVMTGFRVALGGGQELYSITPDLTTLGKIIGGGLAVGAFCGRKDIMQMIAPSGPVYQAGTLAGNPIAVTAGLATLEKISKPGFHEQLNSYGHQLANGLKAIASQHSIPLVINQVGGMFGIFFTEQENITCFSEVMACNKNAFVQFFHAMLEQNVLLAPSAFECGFFTSAHTAVELEKTLKAAEKAFAQVSEVA